MKGYEKLSLLFVSQPNSGLGKTHETPQNSQYAYNYKSVISFTLNKEEFPSLLPVYSPLGSFADSDKSSARVQKSSEKNVFPISQPNIHNSVSIQKSITTIDMPVKFSMTRATQNSSKVSSKVYLGNANRVLRKDVLKPGSIATCNLIFANYPTTSHPHCLQMSSDLRA